MQDYQACVPAKWPVWSTISSEQGSVIDCVVLFHLKGRIYHCIWPLFLLIPLIAVKGWYPWPYAIHRTVVTCRIIGEKEITSRAMWLYSTLSASCTTAAAACEPISGRSPVTLLRTHTLLWRQCRGKRELQWATAVFSNSVKSHLFFNFVFCSLLSLRYFSLSSG